MRPVRRNSSPQSTDYKDYKDAKTDIISRISKGSFNGFTRGMYCSYCERNIPTNFAIEHIEPQKGKFGRPGLVGRWSNFLLACVNCNSTKLNKSIFFNYYLFPDRDNTFNAFTYFADGTIEPSAHLCIVNKVLAINTLELFGLDKAAIKSTDSNGNYIAQDRAGQRLEIWGIAEEALIDYIDSPNKAVIKSIVNLMLDKGFFSVWMTVFKDIPMIRNLFIDSITGTRESGCFDAKGNSNFKHPNKDGLIIGKYKNFPNYNQV